MTFLGLLNAITACVVRALCGLLLVALVPVFLVALLCGWVDQDTAWALKWVCTVFSPFFVAFVFIFWKAFHLARTGRHIGIWATFLVWWGTVGVEALLLYFGAYNLR